MGHRVLINASFNHTSSLEYLSLDRVIASIAARASSMGSMSQLGQTPAISAKRRRSKAPTIRHTARPMARDSHVSSPARIGRLRQ
jgi:hypothetical protein